MSAREIPAPHTGVDRRGTGYVMCPVCGHASWHIEGDPDPVEAFYAHYTRAHGTHAEDCDLDEDCSCEPRP